MELKRGEIYYINFPQTFDPRYKDGKMKFIVVLQEGEYFKDYQTVTVLLTTSDKEAKGYPTSVTIEKGTTKLDRETYILCSQPYTIKKSLFVESGVWSPGNLNDIEGKMDELDEAMYLGLCMGIHQEEEKEETE